MSVAFTITSAEMRAYRDMTGDTNPIHFDAAFAKARGFAGPIVYGGLVIGQVSRLLGTQMPGPGCVWQSINLRFRQPLYVGQTAQVAATVRHEARDLGVFVLAIRVSGPAGTVADGEAMAMLPKAAPVPAQPDVTA